MQEVWSRHLELEWDLPRLNSRSFLPFWKPVVHCMRKNEYRACVKECMRNKTMGNESWKSVWLTLRHSIEDCSVTDHSFWNSVYSLPILFSRWHHRCFFDNVLFLVYNELKKNNGITKIRFSSVLMVTDSLLKRTILIKQLYLFVLETRYGGIAIGQVSVGVFL